MYIIYIILLLVFIGAIVERNWQITSSVKSSKPFWKRPERAMILT